MKRVLPTTADTMAAAVADITRISIFPRSLQTNTITRLGERSLFNGILPIISTIIINYWIRHLNNKLLAPRGPYSRIYSKYFFNNISSAALLYSTSVIYFWGSALSRPYYYEYRVFIIYFSSLTSFFTVTFPPTSSLFSIPNSLVLNIITVIRYIIKWHHAHINVYTCVRNLRVPPRVFRTITFFLNLFI